MVYGKNALQTGATITKSALDNMENGIAGAIQASEFVFTYLAAPSGGDDTAAIQAALDAFDNTPMPGVNFQNSSGAFQAGAQANGGGTVVLGPGVWTASNIVLGHRQRLIGSGWVTVLRQKAGSSGHFISNQRDSSIHAQYCEVADIQIDGNKANQSATNHGIYFLGDKANNYTSTLDEDYDINCRIRNVYVRGFKGYGIYLDGSGENLLSDFKILRCDAGGLYTYQDNYIANGTVGWSGGHGVTVAGDDCRITNVKAWFSTLAGFYVTADSGCITGCSAQDNIRQGLLMDSAYGVIVTGFMADSNSRTNAGTYYQIDIYNSAFCVVSAVARNRYNANGPGTKGLKHSNGSTSNDITFVGATSPWGVSTPYSTTESTKVDSRIVVNGVAQ